MYKSDTESLFLKLPSGGVAQKLAVALSSNARNVKQDSP